MANILLTSHGTYGDVFPFLRLGRTLKERGHAVTLVTHCVFAEHTARAGLEFISFDTPDEYRQMVKYDDLLLSPLKDPDALRTYNREYNPIDKTRREYEILAERCQLPDSIIISRHFTGLAGLMAAEKLSVPVVWVALAPYFLSVLPLAVQLSMAVAGDEINALRLEIGLSPIKDWLAWFRSPCLNLGLWPAWFGQMQPDWPPKVQLTGFIAGNVAEGDEISSEVEDLLSSGEPIVVITGSSGTLFNTKFHTVALEACQLLGIRCLLVVTYQQFLPEHLPEGVLWVKRLPFARVFPRLSAVIHHGGVGTLARAVFAGIPQLILADGIDRPNNGARLQHLGVAEYLPPLEWKPEVVANALRRLLGSESVSICCRDLAQRANETDAANEACGYIEALLEEKSYYQASPAFFEQTVQSTGVNPIEEKHRLTAMGLSKEIQPTTSNTLSPEMRQLLARRLAKKKAATQSSDSSTEKGIS
jgi:UDP:flavonoid glycosyltransferase YjiC (YdhE family)